MSVSVVVPTYNRRELLLRTLPTLFVQSFPRDQYEIIVVDDGSNDGTTEAVRSLHPPCALRIIEQHNQGLASARNTGLRAATGDIVLFVDDDMFCGPELIAAHVSIHLRHPNAVAFGAVLESEDTPRTLAAECFAREFTAFHAANIDRDDITVPPIAWLMSNTSVPRAALLTAGGFNRRFKREDAELCLRLKHAGLNFQYAPRAIARHHYAKPARELLREELDFARSDVLMLAEHPEWHAQSRFSVYAAEPAWKKLLRGTLVRTPLLPELLLSTCWKFVEWLGPHAPGWILQVGVKTLQWHRALVWSRGVRRLLAKHSSKAVAASR